MQLTLDDLRKSNDPLAALLVMSDSALDRLAAEAHGWETVVIGYWEKGERTFREYNGDVPCIQGKDGYYNTPSAVKWSEHFEEAGQCSVGTYFAKLNDDGELDCMAEAGYQPSRKLDQAYELEQRCREQCGLYVRRIWGSGKFMYILTPLTEPGEAYDKDRAGVWESQAGSHARAVVVLAILGLLGKDGAA